MRESLKNTITIDGPSGAGKSTVAKGVAKRLGYLYLDTGAMYRAYALLWWRIKQDRGGEPPPDMVFDMMRLEFRRDGENNRIYLNGEDVTLKIRTPKIDMLSSTLSALPHVRERMVEIQRGFLKHGPLVAEGRDMGSKVFTEAGFKFFLTADLKVRAYRRYMERIQRGEDCNLEDVLLALKKRDKQDSQREVAPLVIPKGAKVIDTTNLGIMDVIEEILRYVLSHNKIEMGFGVDLAPKL